ncbi:MAG: glycosyltransferase [Candidatus Eisenbacteria bacterium]|nr:glycosyltransferase [Candidatus Eisenbacteria bacterium]
MALRLLAYSHDTVGLGHLRRTLGICGDLVGWDPALSALIVTGSPVAEGFHLPDRVDYVKLPSVRKCGNSTYESRSLNLGFDELRRMRSSVIRDTTRGFAPDVLLVDKTPAGLKGELRATLEDLRERGSRTLRILGLREILDNPAEMRAEYEREGLWDFIAEHYDAVWVYGERGIYDTVREYEFPEAVAAKTAFVGYLPKYNGLLPREAVASELALEGRRLVVVTAGGGEDGYPLFDHYLAGLEGAPADAGVLHCLVTGPAMPAAQQAALRERAARPDVYFTNFSDHMTSLFAAADLVVTMGGYNTVTEILSLRRRAVVVPRVVPRMEQLIRAQRLASRGLVRMIHPAELTPGHLFGVVSEELSGGDSPITSTLEFRGHQGVRQELARLLKLREPDGVRDTHTVDGARASA